MWNDPKIKKLNLAFLTLIGGFLCVPLAWAGDIEAMLTTANGTTNFEIKDSGAVIQFQVDSDGNTSWPQGATSSDLTVPTTNATPNGTITAAEGSIAYDTTGNMLYVNTDGGTTWTELTTGGAGGGTLDQSYDFGGGGVGRAISADSGAVQFTVPDTSNNVGLEVIQNDVTNNPNNAAFTNTGTGANLFLNQDGNGIALNIDTEQTTTDVINIDGTTLTSGSLIEATVDDSFANNSALFNVTGTALNTASTVVVNQLSTTPANDVDITAIHIEQGANDPRILFDEGDNEWKLDQGQGAGAVTISTGAAAGNTLDQSYDQGGAGAGRALTVDSGAVQLTVPDTSNNVGLEVIQNDTTNNPNNLVLTNTGTGSDLFLDQDGNGIALNIDSESTSADVLNLDTATTSGIIFDINSSTLDSGTVFDIDGSALTTGALLTATVDDTFNADQALFDITGTALNSDARVMQISLTDGGGADIDAIYIDRDTADARIFYNDATERWQVDQGDGSGLVNISTGAAGGSTLDEAYDQGGAGAGRTITVDTGAVQLTGSNAADETIEITNSANGGVVLVENTGSGDSFRVNDSGGDATPFVIDDDGNVGIGLTVPNTSLEVDGTITFTPSATASITAGGGITVTDGIMLIQGNGGAVDITANPQIAAGTHGQILILQGTSDTNTVQLDDGNGLSLASDISFTIGNRDVIKLFYNNTLSLWIELERSNN